MDPFEIGKAEIRRQGTGIAILAFGTMVMPAMEAAESMDATVVNMRFVKPLDHELILNMAQSHQLLVTIEENVIAGGAGSAVSESLSAAGIDMPLLHLGLPDEFPHQGSREHLLAECGLDAEGIRRTIRRAAPVELAAVLGSA